MDNWSKQFFKANVLHLSLTLFTLIPSSLSLQQNKMLCWQKEKKFLNYLCFFFGRTACRWVTFPGAWSWEGGKAVAAARVVCPGSGWDVGLSSRDTSTSASDALAALLLQWQFWEAAAATGPGWCGRREFWLLFQAGTLQSVWYKKKKGKTTPDTSPFSSKFCSGFCAVSIASWQMNVFQRAIVRSSLDRRRNL